MEELFSDKLFEVQQFNKNYSYKIEFNEKLNANILTVFCQDDNYKNRYEINTFVIENVKGVEKLQAVSEMSFLIKGKECKVVKFITNPKFQKMGFGRKMWNTMLISCALTNVENVWGSPRVIAEMNGYDNLDEDFKEYYQQRDLTKIYKKLGCVISDEDDLRFDFPLSKNHILNNLDGADLNLVSKVVNGKEK